MNKVKNIDCMPDTPYMLQLEDAPKRRFPWGYQSPRAIHSSLSPHPQNTALIGPTIDIE